MFTKNDLANYKALKAVIRQGDFEVKGDAITMVASLLHWYDTLEGKIEDAVNKASIPKINPIE